MFFRHNKAYERFTGKWRHCLSMSAIDNLIAASRSPHENSLILPEIEKIFCISIKIIISHSNETFNQFNIYIKYAPIVCTVHCMMGI